MLNSLRPYFTQISTRHLVIAAIVLCIPAFLINLGLIGFIGDEGIRTLVAFEMKHSGDFVVPTLNGEQYFNKPPLYNWLIYAMSSLFGYFGEWPSRLTTLISLACFAIVVYINYRKQMDKLTAASIALMLLTCGRILFWDSMLGLIDICFSAVVFLNFMILYHKAQKEKWRSLFLISWLLFSIAFMLKGLPAVVFQAISILTTLILFRQIRRLFSFEHMWCAIIGCLPLIGYYVVYARSVSIEHVFAILTDQSLQRTGTHHGLWKTLMHVFIFPLEQFYHFLPWTLLFATLFHPKFRTWLKENKFIRFCFWMLMANLPVYWLSVQVYPRYLLMFIPLITLVSYYILQRSLEINQRWWKPVHITFSVMAGLATLAVMLMWLFPPVRSLHNWIWVWIVGSVMMILCCLGLISDSRRMIVWLSLSLLIIRSCFDLVVLPIRARTFSENLCREDVKRAALNNPDIKWLIYGDTETHQVARFYTSAYTDQIIRKDSTATDRNALYLVDRKLYPEFPGIQIDSVMLERGQVLGLMKMGRE